jgi:hypothetical protein
MVMGRVRGVFHPKPLLEQLELQVERFFWAAFLEPFSSRALKAHLFRQAPVTERLEPEALKASSLEKSAASVRMILRVSTKARRV